MKETNERNEKKKKVEELYDRKRGECIDRRIKNGEGVERVNEEEKHDKNSK